MVISMPQAVNLPKKKKKAQEFLCNITFHNKLLN